MLNQTSDSGSPPEDKTNVWVRIYRRPNGESVRAWITYEKEPELEVKAKEIEDLGIEITMEEVFGSSINVCFDTGEFDYEYKLWGHDEVAEKLRELILAFDKEDFENARYYHGKTEEGGPDADE